MSNEKAPRKIPRTFPLRVNQKWLDDIDKVRKVTESKHEFILKAVQNYIQERKREE